MRHTDKKKVSQTVACRALLSLAIVVVSAVVTVYGMTLFAPKSQPVTQYNQASTKVSTESSKSPAPAIVSAGDLTNPVKQEIANELVGSFENSTTSWWNNFGYIKDIHDGRGYTCGIIGFTTAFGDVLAVVKRYSQLSPDNTLEKYTSQLTALAAAQSASTDELGNFAKDWTAVAADAKFRQAQIDVRTTEYLTPALALAKQHGLKTALGQFAYYDAMIRHGMDSDRTTTGLADIAQSVTAKKPADGGDEKAYLAEFFIRRLAVLRAEQATDDTDRVAVQQQLLNDGNVALTTPMHWNVYGDSYRLAADPKPYAP